MDIIDKYLADYVAPYLDKKYEVEVGRWLINKENIINAIYNDNCKEYLLDILNDLNTRDADRVKHLMRAGEVTNESIEEQKIIEDIPF